MIGAAATALGDRGGSINFKRRKGDVMGLTLDRGRFYWVKRVPKRYLGLVRGEDGKPVTQVRAALHTDSRAEAVRKAKQVEAARLAEWEALLHGDTVSAHRHYDAARRLAAARGFDYVPMADLAGGDLNALVARVLALAKAGGGLEPSEVAAAVLGAVPAAYPTLPGMLAEYIKLVETRHVQKSPAQLHRWKLPRERAVANFVAVTSPKDATGAPAPVPVDAITRQDALRFREWWQGRIATDGHKIETANKDFGHLSEIWTTWADLTQSPLPNPFAKLRLDGDDSGTTPPFSRAWVADRLLAAGALDGLNEDARDVLLVMVNTGIRPSEAIDAPLADWHVGAPIPFLRIAANGRQLKVKHTARDIPLLGVSLEAARRIAARGGVQRYAGKAPAWSAAVNKYLTDNKLRETPGHTAYSLRHYVEDQLLAAGVDDRVRADILGHKYERPRYGDGGALPGRRAALALIAL